MTPPSSSPPDLTSSEALEIILHELTVERLHELSEIRRLETRDANEIVATLVIDRNFDHDDALEYCTVHELKDVCRAFDLPIDGGQAESLRRRIRHHLYLPATTIETECPEGLDEAAKLRERRLAKRHREHAQFRRGLVVRHGVGAGCALFLIGWISPFQDLSGALLLLPVGIAAGSFIASRQPDHVTSALVFGVATATGNIGSVRQGLGSVDFFLWMIATAIGGITGLSVRLAGEMPRGVEIQLDGPPEKRPLMDLIRLLPDPRLNSLALEIDLDLPADCSRESLLARIAAHGAFDRERTLRNLEEPELREIARRLEMSEANGDLDEHELRAEIVKRFEIAFDVR